MEILDVLLHRIDERGLILLDGSSDLWSHEECIEAGEDSEHLASVSCGSQSISEPGDDLILDSRDPLVAGEEYV